jgi:hypothetical protein
VVAADQSGRSVPSQVFEKIGWGTWIRTKIDGVRVRSSTVELSPIGEIFPATFARQARFLAKEGRQCKRRETGARPRGDAGGWFRRAVGRNSWFSPAFTRDHEAIPPEFAGRVSRAGGGGLGDY